MPQFASPLEFLAQKYNHVVKYDAQGNPSIFVRFPKMKSIELDASLPDHTHPAFIINGVEQSEILIGKYMACELATNGTLYSIPNSPPRVALGADEFLTRMRAAGTGISGKTVADSGFLLLLAKKNGWVPKGNNNYSVDYRDGTNWLAATAYTAGNKRVLWGWEYECLQNHTSANENRPDKAPLHWTRGKFIGATPVLSQIATATPNGYNTLTGTGPLSWYLNGKESSLADIVGNASEQDYGYRIYDGEIQILENNNAADPAADLSSGSAAWKAILPSAVDASYTLVAPGTAGTLKWNKSGTYPELDTVITVRTTANETMSRAFKNLTANAVNVPYIPTILQELGIFPIPGDTTQGTVYYRNHVTTEYIPRRGGDYSNASSAGLGYVYSSNTRASSGVYYGARPRSLETL